MSGRLVGRGRDIVLLRHRRWDGVHRTASDEVLARSSAGGSAWWEWRLKRDTKIDRIALAEVYGAEATRTKSNLRGVTGHFADRALQLSGCWRFM